MKRFFAFYKNSYKNSTKKYNVLKYLFLKPLMYIKTVDKIIGKKNFFWTPLSEKTGARNGKKTLKMANFRPKKGKI